MREPGLIAVITQPLRKVFLSMIENTRSNHFAVTDIREIRTDSPHRYCTFDIVATDASFGRHQLLASFFLAGFDDRRFL